MTMQSIVMSDGVSVRYVISPNNRGNRAMPYTLHAYCGGCGQSFISCGTKGFSNTEKITSFIQERYTWHIAPRGDNWNEWTGGGCRHYNV